MGISTSIGFYDFLNYLTIGAILSFIFVPWLPESTEELVLWAMPCFVVGLIFHKVVENTIGSFTRNNNELILLSFKDKAKYSNKKIEEPVSIRKNYYHAYYSLSENNQLGNIPELESFSSFFQDMYFVVLIYIIASSFLLVYSLGTQAISIINVDFTLCIIYGIICTICFLLATVFVFYIPWKKLGTKYSDCAKYTFYFLAGSFLILAAYAGLALSGQSLTVPDKMPSYNELYETFVSNIHPPLIRAGERMVIPLQFLSIFLLPLFLFLRYYTEKKIFGLVWEGYIIMHLNKKI